jgi:uncharacterized peroxidase-related enzyme
MTIIHPIGDDEATGVAAELFEQDRAGLGYVPIHSRIMAINPEAVRAFESLVRAATAQMDLRRYELVTLAAAGALRSQACRLAHGKKTLKCMDEDELIRVARDHRNAGLSEAEVAMMTYAEKLSTDSAAMTEADADALRKVGFSDREIVDITLAAAARNYYSRALQAMAVPVDVPPDLSDELRQALLTGTE